MQGKTDWTDLNRDGRRLEYIIRQCHKKAKNSLIQENDEMYFSYIDRVIKATNAKASLADTVLNIQKVIRFGKKIKK